MSPRNGTLNLLTFPQRWDPVTGDLQVRVLCLPRTAPDQPLAPGLPDLAHADLRFEAQRVPSADDLPRAGDALGTGWLLPRRPAVHKAELFAALAQAISIDSSPRSAAPTAPRLRKPVTESYRSLVGGRPLSRHLTGDAEHACALQEAAALQPPAPVTVAPTLRWGQVIALALRQPLLAEGLGLVTELSVPAPPGGWADGGWVFTTLHDSSDGAAVPGLALSFAAHVPALAGPRAVFAPVLFPVGSTTTVGDHSVPDATRYVDGHARLVHGEQVHDDTGDAVRLAWDDERVAGWLDRQLAPDVQTPMGTAGFRVDVREAGEPGWTSLCRVRGADVTLGSLSLGPYDGEAMVEVVPVGPRAGAAEYWLPRWFVTWRGSSVVAPDPDLVALHQLEGVAWEPGTERTRLSGSDLLRPHGLDHVRLLYGHDYQFRVRMADLTGGGPAPEDPLPGHDDGPPEHLTTTVRFRRRRPPGAVEVRHDLTRDEPFLLLDRPRLPHPDALFTGASLADLMDDLAGQRARHAVDPGGGHLRGLGLPDPDVVSLRITVQARALAGDGATWHDLYATSRTFPPVASEPLRVEARFVDLATLDTLPAPQDDGPLELPTARDLRLVLTPVGRDDAGYFAVDDDGSAGTDAARTGPGTTVEVHARPEVEDGLLEDGEVRALFLRMPPPDGSVARPVERLADETGLQVHGLTVTGRPGRRTVLAASAGLRHRLAPERSALTFSSDPETCQQWVCVVRVRLARDWTWRGPATAGITVHRQVRRGPDGDEDPSAPERPVPVGTVRLPHAVSPAMTGGLAPDDPRDPGRGSTDVVFVDVLDPRADPQAPPGSHPAELTVTYSLVPVDADGTATEPVVLDPVRLPVTTPPAQVPRLLSAGLSTTPATVAADYSRSGPRRRALWVELAEAPTDPGDGYFVRVLAVAPDPLLTDEEGVEPVEPALAVDPEWVRVVSAGQPADQHGRGAMQPLSQRAEEGHRYLVPLPPGVGPDSPELLGMYTYELRVGHADDRWCTAQGRWGPPLRVTGVQHPAPALSCRVTRSADAVVVRAPFATPVHRGSHVRPTEPLTQLWALLYARVQQGDGQGWRNLLLGARPLTPVPREPGPGRGPAEPAVLPGETRFGQDDVGGHLRLAGLPRTSPLTALVAEVLTRPAFEDPLGTELGHARLLRVSDLVPVPDLC